MLILPNAILFDMDGTITEPLLDFPRIRREMGIESRPILEALAEMEEGRRREAEAVLLRHEDEAAAVSKLGAGCRELLGLIGGRGIRAALITRNSRRSARIVVERHELEFEVLITREDGKFKPDPASLWEACERLGVERAGAWMVGDGQYDVEAGRAAGVRTVWVSHGRERAFEAEPWRTVRDLVELTGMVRECLG